MRLLKILSWPVLLRIFGNSLHCFIVRCFSANPMVEGRVS